MPIYEYRCAACEHELEAIQRFSDAPLLTCPACGKDTLNKLLSAAGFQLKGSGWYATDFKHSGSKPAAKTAATTDSAAGDGKATNAESTNSKDGADAKTEAKPSTGAKPATADTPASTAGSSTTGS